MSHQGVGERPVLGSPAAGGDEACPPNAPAAAVQGTAARSGPAGHESGRPNLPPLATVVHTSYSSVPATGIPVDSNPYYPGAPTSGGGAPSVAPQQVPHSVADYPLFPSGVHNGFPGAMGRGAPTAPGTGGQQFVAVDGTTIQIPEGMAVEHHLARQLSRSLKLFTCIDILLCLLYVFVGYIFLAFAIIGPICGYYGAKNYQRQHTLCYIVFCFINLTWRLAVGTRVVDIFDQN